MLPVTDFQLTTEQPFVVGFPFQAPSVPLPQTGLALVTGATGFIGGHLVEHLLAQGCDVRALVRPRSRGLRGLPRSVEVLCGDVTDPDSLASLPDSVGVVYHLAGATVPVHASGFRAVNTQGTENLALACQKCANPPVLIHVSSLAAGGPARDGIPRRENDLPQPVSDYGSSKLAAEVALRRLADRVPITVLRPPGVFGPRERFILGLFRAAKRGWVALPQGGNQRVALLHVRDLVACMEQAALHGRRLDVKTSPARESRGVYQVAAREQPTIVEMANRIAAILGHPRPVRVVYVPRRVVWSAATAAQVAWEVRRRRGFFNRDKMREAFAGDWTCDPRRAERELGFRASAPLDDQLRETADWYREHGWL